MSKMVEDDIKEALEFLEIIKKVLNDPLETFINEVEIMIDNKNVERSFREILTTFYQKRKGI